MGHQKIKIIVALGLAAAVIGAVYWLRPGTVKPLSNKKIQVNGQELTVEIADTAPAQQLGLSYRDSLPAEGGMLFVYQDKATRYFWMPDMRFSLDAIWIANDKVVGWQENIPPLTNGAITQFQSNVPADAALEVNAGWIGRHGIKVGDTVVYN